MGFVNQNIRIVLKDFPISFTHLRNISYQTINLQCFNNIFTNNQFTLFKIKVFKTQLVIFKGTFSAETRCELGYCGLTDVKICFDFKGVLKSG